jgi:hypothetical protein
VAHCFGPAAVDAERSGRYEEGDQGDEREYSAGCPKSMSQLREKRLAFRAGLVRLAGCRRAACIFTSGSCARRPTSRTRFLRSATRAARAARRAHDRGMPATRCSSIAGDQCAPRLRRDRFQGVEAHRRGLGDRARAPELPVQLVEECVLERDRLLPRPQNRSQSLRGRDRIAARGLSSSERREGVERGECGLRAEDHNGCNGCTRRSLGFADVRSPDP